MTIEDRNRALPDAKSVLRRRGRGRPRIVQASILGLLGMGAPVPDDESSRTLLDSYYKNNGSMMKVATENGIPFTDLHHRRLQDHAFGKCLDLIDEMHKDEVHAQFMDKVKDGKERNPTWKIFYLKNHDPRYAEKAAKEARAPSVVINIRDARFEQPPQIIETQAVREELKEASPDDLDKPMKVAADDSIQSRFRPDLDAETYTTALLRRNS